MRRITLTLALAAALWAPTAIAAPASTAITAPTQTRAAAILEGGGILRAIDGAFYSGALTWSEASALYAEHAAIRADYVQKRVDNGDELASRRAAFMIRVAQSTLARLTYNAVRRVDVEIRIAAF